MQNLFWFLLIFFLGGIAYRRRASLLGALRRFDARNAARQREQLLQRVHPDAHYAETLRVADEEVEPVSEFQAPDARTGIMLPRYVFQGTQYATREEAVEARLAAIADKARAFYADLDGHWLQRRERPVAELPAPEKIRPPRL
jgi:hypothetical protein